LANAYKFIDPKVSIQILNDIDQSTINDKQYFFKELIRLFKIRVADATDSPYQIYEKIITFNNRIEDYISKNQKINVPGWVHHELKINDIFLAYYYSLTGKKNDSINILKTVPDYLKNNLIQLSYLSRTWKNLGDLNESKDYQKNYENILSSVSSRMNEDDRKKFLEHLNNNFSIFQKNI